MGVAGVVPSDSEVLGDSVWLPFYSEALLGLVCVCEDGVQAVSECVKASVCMSMPGCVVRERWWASLLAGEGRSGGSTCHRSVHL